MQEQTPLTFPPINFEYKGQQKTVRPSNVLRLIALVEQILTPTIISSQIAPSAGAAIIHAQLLRFAGFNNVDEYAIAKEFKASPEKAVEVIARCLDLLGLLNAPEEIREQSEKKAEPPGEKPENLPQAEAE